MNTAMLLKSSKFTNYILLYQNHLLKQGRRRVFKSGPAEEIIERRCCERGESTRGGNLVRGLGGIPKKILNF